MPSSNRVSLKGSERTALPGAHITGATDPHQLIEISVILRHSTPLTESMNLAENRIQRMTRSQYAERHGANPADIERIKQFAQ